MKVTDAFVNDIVRNMGVDVDKKKPPHWIQVYYESKSKFGGKYPDGYMCSRCGKKSWVKNDVCDGCNSVMANSDKILSDLKKVADVVEVKHGEWIVSEECKTPLSHGYIRTERTYICPFCHHHFRKKMKFCGECGAKMDGGNAE